MRTILAVVAAALLTGACGCGLPFGKSNAGGGDSRETPKGEQLTAEQKQERMRREEAQAVHAEALALTQKGQYREAIAKYARAIQLMPKEAVLYINLGRNLYLMGDYEKALEAYRLASETGTLNDATASVLHANTGDIYRQREQYDKATSHYLDAVRLAPDSARLQYELGNMYLKQEKYKSAEYRLNRAIELDPQFQRAIVARVILYHLTGRDTLAWKDAQLLEKQGFQVDGDLRRSILDGRAAEENSQRFQPAH